jgi:hypothetical protein
MKGFGGLILIGAAVYIWLCSPSKAMAQGRGRPIFGQCGYYSCYGSGDTPRKLALDPEGFKEAKERNKLKSRIQAEKDVWGISYTEICFIRQYGFRPVFD